MAKDDHAAKVAKGYCETTAAMREIEPRSQSWRERRRALLMKETEAVPIRRNRMSLRWDVIPGVIIGERILG